jgi:tripartite-type tricarboxylate transporter receptor subunit TctC
MVTSDVDNNVGFGSKADAAAMMIGVDLVHVPYRANLVPDLLAGQVQLVFAPIPTVIGYVKAGKLRALAVTSTTRVPALPNTPTMTEFVPGYEASTWFGIGAPNGVPAEIILKLNKEVNVGPRRFEDDRAPHRPWQRSDANDSCRVR